MQSISAHWSPPATVGRSAPACESGCKSGGVSVSILPTVASFFSSLSPDYSLQDKRQKTNFIPSPVASTADKSQSASDMIHKVRLASTVLSCWVPSVKVVSDVVATLCSSVSAVQDLGAVLARKERGKSAAGTVPAVATFALVALDSLGSAGARPLSGQHGSAEKPILVPDSKTLSMIGQDGYPANAFYRQTRSFSYPNAEPGPSFKGYYDGGCHTISDLQTCLFRDLDRHAEVRNLRLSHIAIDGDLAGLACTMESFARVSDIRVENATIVNHRSGNYHQPAATGVVIGHQHKAAQLADISLNNCLVNTTGRYSVAGGVVAIADGHLDRANVTRSQVITNGGGSFAGLGAGSLGGEMDDLTLVDSQVFTHGRSSAAGGGAGMLTGDIRRVGASRCHVSTTGDLAAGGIGAGFVFGSLSQISGVGCLVAASGQSSPAGIGAGQVGFIVDGPLLRDLVAIDSDVSATGDGAGAGVAAGIVYKEVDRVTSVRCQVTSRYMAGVGAGINFGGIDGLNSVNNTVTGVNGGGIRAGNNNGTTNLMSWNSRVNGELRNIGTPELQNLCQSADPLFINPDCTAALSPRDALQRDCQATYVFPRRGTTLRPIEVDSAETLNRIGLESNYPASAHYVQTGEIDGSKLDNHGSVVFSGHYDGQNHVIRNQTACLFKNLFGTVRNLHLVNARIDSDQPVAVVACEMDGVGGIKNILIDNCRVASSGHRVSAGIICGQQKSNHNKVSLIEIRSSVLRSDGDVAAVGMIAGQCRGLNEQVTIRNSQVSTSGERSRAGLGCGESEGVFRYFSAACCQVETTGPRTRSGIAVGHAYFSRLGPATILNCNLTTSGQVSDAGLATGLLGWGVLNNFTMLDSRVLAREANAAAGIGRVYVSSRAKGLTAVRCEVLTEGNGAHAGIGVGLINRGGGYVLLEDVTSVNSTLSAPGRYAHVSGSYANGRPMNATGVRIANTRINGELHNNINISAQNSSTFCAGADLRFVNPACQVNQSVSPSGCLSTPLTIAVPTLPTIPAATVLTIAAPTPPLLATGLSAGAVAGITVGTVLVLGAALAGYCCYHYRRSAEGGPNSTHFHHCSGECGHENKGFAISEV